MSGRPETHEALKLRPPMRAICAQDMGQIEPSSRLGLVEDLVAIRAWAQVHVTGIECLRSFASTGSVGAKGAGVPSMACVTGIENGAHVTASAVHMPRRGEFH
jgi:hypothetical protein